MFGFKRKKKDTNVLANENHTSHKAVDKPQKAETKTGFFSRLKQGLAKTRSNLTDGIATLIHGKKEIDAELLEDIEAVLIQADVGVDTTQAIIADITERVERKSLTDPTQLFQVLKEHLLQILTPVAIPYELPSQAEPVVILMVGINGAGKTTTIGKLAKQFQQQDKNVMLAAGDTFRAAAVEQLQVWGDRNDITVIAQPESKDSASVIFDAMHAATARKIDVLLADTAGRLHTQVNLMAELEKVKRVIQKVNPQAPHEVFLVIDAGIGQNALQQVQEFKDAIGVTGLVLTKLDGTAKGGIVFSVAKQTQLPIRYIGIGEQIDDLRSFDAESFVNALLSRE